MAEHNNDDWDIPDDGRGHLPEHIERAIMGDVTKRGEFFDAGIDINQLPSELREQLIEQFENPFIIAPGKGLVHGQERTEHLSWIRRHIMERALEGKRPRWYVRMMWFWLVHKVIVTTIFILALVACLIYSRL